MITKRSKILKVVSILLIIFSIIWIVSCCTGILVLGRLSENTDVWILDIVSTFGTVFLIRLIITKAVGLAAGICGLSVKRKKPLIALGVIVLILTAISVATKFFIPFIWVLMALPILYLVGIRRCTKADLR